MTPTPERSSQDIKGVRGYAKGMTVFPPEPASGQGRRHGTSSNEPFDRWFRYPAGFASDYASALLTYLNLAPGALIVDPFAGSAVTGTATRLAQYSFVGLEAHPLIAELANLKLAEPPSPPTELTALAENLAAAITQPAQLALPIEEEPELIQRCFSEDVLRKLICLRDLIKASTDDSWFYHLKWALLATLRDVASVRVGWPYQRPGSARKPKFSDPLARFRQRIAWMAADLEQISAMDAIDNYSARVTAGDSRRAEVWCAGLDKPADGCVSSPPYLNNFDYADATRLELYFWGEVTSWAAMCSTVRSEMIISTTQQTTVASSAQALETLSRFNYVHGKIRDLTEQLQAQRLLRRRGKEYDRVVPAYFSAMAHVLENLSANLNPGAPVILLIGDSAPYGIYIDTPSLITDLGNEFGLTSVKDVVLRHRGRRWANNPGRHAISLSERLVIMNRT